MIIYRNYSRLSRLLEVIPLKKIIVVSLGFISAAYAAVAGGLLDAHMEPEIMEVAPASSAAGWIIPLLLLGVVAAVIASDSGGS